MIPIGPYGMMARRVTCGWSARPIFFSEMYRWSQRTHHTRSRTRISARTVHPRRQRLRERWNVLSARAEDTRHLSRGTRISLVDGRRHHLPFPHVPIASRGIIAHLLWKLIVARARGQRRCEFIVEIVCRAASSIIVMHGRYQAVAVPKALFRALSGWVAAHVLLQRTP